MMLLTRIELDNFGPYLGHTSLELGARDMGLVIIHGENMSGKTSLLNAVRWGLYGVALDRAGKSMPTKQLINARAFADGERRVSVTLHVIQRDDGGDIPVRLRRQYQAKSGIGSPSADRDFAPFLEAELDGNIQPASKYDDIVNGLLPQRISRFFLFDGELLRDYEELVRDESTSQATDVKQAIEMILGVPAALNGRDDMQFLRGQALRRYTKEARKQEGLTDVAGRAEEVQATIDDLIKTETRLKSQREDQIAELRQVVADLETHQHLRADALKVAEVEKTIDRLNTDSREKGERRRDNVKQVWRDILAPRLKHDVERLGREREAIGRALADQSVLKARRASLQSAVQRDRCETCGQALLDESKAEVRAEIAEVDARLDDLAPRADSARHDELGATIQRLRDVAPAGVASAIAELERDLAANAVEIYKAKRQLAAHQEKLQGFDPDVYRRYEDDKSRLDTLSGKLSAALEDNAEKLRKAREELRGLERRMKERDVPALRRLKHEVDLWTGAAELFDRSVDALTDQLRSDVETTASQIFRELTTDKSYQGLRINENYGLTILNKDGKAVTVRSAGAEQIVALSLIGALNRMAAKRGPVIMDTPFGRLDRSHRENILRFVPALAEQVTLLVHSGELDREQDLAPLQGRIVAEYEIHHLDSGQSEIEERAA